MNKTTFKFFIALVLLITSCGKYIPQLNKTIAAHAVFTQWLTVADTIAPDKKKKFFDCALYYKKCRCNDLEKIQRPKEFTKKYKNKKSRTEHVKVLRAMSVDKGDADTLAKFLSSVCDSGFFIRTFEMDESEMFYRFEKPNEQGLGIMYLSDRYKKDFFDRKSATNKYFIKEYSYVFPRIYFIRENKLHILSGDIDLTDRKVFERLPVSSDTIFKKNSTFRKDNSDKIYDLSYHFKYVNYSDMETRWQRVAGTKEDSAFITKDMNNYIDFDELKNIMQQSHTANVPTNINLTDTSALNKWFYAGTLDENGYWISNNTTLRNEKEIWICLEDSTKDFFVNVRMYYRKNPPGEFKPDKQPQEFKGEISGSINKNDRVFIKNSKIISDINGNRSVWLQLLKIIREKK